MDVYYPWANVTAVWFLHRLVVSAISISTFNFYFFSPRLLTLIRFVSLPFLSPLTNTSRQSENGIRFGYRHDGYFEPTTIDDGILLSIPEGLFLILRPHVSHPKML